MEMYQEHHRMFRSLSPTRLFFRCAVPSMISMAFSSLYMIADGIFVGRFLGSQALAAVNLVMPIIIMSFAISDMVAVGSAVQISIALGRKDTEKANQLFSFACSIIFVISCIVCLLGLCLAPALVSLLGSTGMVANLATQYLRVYAGFSPVIMCFFAVDNYLRICGTVKYLSLIHIFQNQVGLHARPATFFIQKANEFKSSIWVEKEERRVNAKSLLGVLSLGIVGGTTIKVIADGADEQEAVDSLINLVKSGFAE